MMGSKNSAYFGREYTVDEIWANFTHFVKEVAVRGGVKESGIVIGFHPDDPAGSFAVRSASYSFHTGWLQKVGAENRVNSPNVGMCLCAGTWAEGGAAMGIDPEGAIRYFGARKQIYEIHYRNVSAPLPHFAETYPDYGYYDMYKVMKALVDVKYDGIKSAPGSYASDGGRESRCTKGVLDGLHEGDAAEGAGEGRRSLPARSRARESGADSWVMRHGSVFCSRFLGWRKGRGQ